MSKWSEMLARVIPWLDTGDSDVDEQRLREETADTAREQEALAPFIADQTAYLERKGKVNGFTQQLRDGFARKAAEQ